jgi:hypothetical protein
VVGFTSREEALDEQNSFFLHSGAYLSKQGKVNGISFTFLRIMTKNARPQKREKQDGHYDNDGSHDKKRSLPDIQPTLDPS